MLKKTKNQNQMVPSPSPQGSAITRRDPFSLWTDMDRLFDSFRSSFDDLFWTPSGRVRPFDMGNLMRQPLMDVEDTGKEFKLAFETPGINKEDVKIEVTGNTLEVSAETRHEEEENAKNYLRRERCVSKFYRALELPEDVVTDKVDAKMENGILEITLPKKEPVEVKKKTIKVK